MNVFVGQSTAHKTKDLHDATSMSPEQRFQDLTGQKEGLHTPLATTGTVLSTESCKPC